MTEAEDNGLDAWQDRAWLIGLAAAATTMVAGYLMGASLWPLMLVAGAMILAGSAVSTRASLARLDEATRRRHTRSIAIGLVLAALVIIFYSATIVRLGGNVVNRSL